MRAYGPQTRCVSRQGVSKVLLGSSAVPARPAEDLAGAMSRQWVTMLMWLVVTSADYLKRRLSLQQGDTHRDCIAEMPALFHENPAPCGDLTTVTSRAHTRFRPQKACRRAGATISE